VILQRNTIAILLLSLLFMACNKDEGEVMETEPTPIEYVGEIVWVKSLGGSGVDQANSIVATQDGNYIVAGTTYSNDGDVTGKTTTDADYWIVKISGTGTVLWDKTYGTEEDEIATHIANTSEGGYLVTGYSRGNNCGSNSNSGFHDYWLLKLNAEGEEEWCQNFGYGGSDQSFDAFETSDGGYFVTGYFDVSASGGEGNEDRSGAETLHGVGEYWCIKMDASGAFVWKRYFGGSNNDRSYKALEMPDGDFLLMGSSESEDFDITDSKGSYDFWAVKVAANGDKVWTKSFGGTGVDVGYGVAPTETGNYFLIGDTRSDDMDVSNNYGNADIWVVEMSAGGMLLSEKSFGGSQFDTGKGIYPISNNNYLLSGSTRSNDQDISFNNGENDAWIGIMDANKNLIFEKSVGGSNLDFGEDAIEALDNTIILVGNTESDDGDIPVNKGLKDFLIVNIK